MVTEIVKYENGEVLEWKWSSNHPMMKKPFWTSAYLIDQLLIDCGAPGGEDELRKFLQNLPKTQIPLKCVITHSHEDHAGGGSFLQNEFNIPIYAPKQSISILEKGYQYAPYRKMSWGEDGLKPFQPQIVPDHFSSGTGKFNFECLQMPGHAPDLTAYIERERQWAFVGDMVLPKYQMLFGETCDIKEDIHVIYLSLNELWEFTEGMKNLKIFVAGHGMFEGRNVIKKRMDEIIQLHKKAHEVMKSQPETYSKKRKLRKTIKLIFGGESFFASMTNGELSRKNMLISLLAWPMD